MRKYLSVFVIMMALLNSKAIYAQTAQEMDNKVAGYLAQLQTLSNDTIDHSDAIGDINDKLSDYMQQILVKPASLSSPFTKSKEHGLDAFVSGDNKVRFYSWDNWTGGTMHFFSDVAQYQSGNGLKYIALDDTATEGDPGYFYSSIHTITTKDNKAIYVVNYEVIGSNRDKGSGIRAYIIQDGKLKRYPFFQTATKMLDDISYGYDFFNNGDGELPAIHFDNSNKKLYIPVVNNDGKFLNKNLVYEFDGNKFVFNKNAK